MLQYLNVYQFSRKYSPDGTQRIKQRLFQHFMLEPHSLFKIHKKPFFCYVNLLNCLYEDKKCWYLADYLKGKYKCYINVHIN